MAKDDYFVMAYKLLSYLYACLKAGKDPLDSGYMDYDTKAFPVGEAYWQYLLRNLYQEGYLQGVALVPILGMAEKGVKLLPNVSITPKGIAYLHENSMMQKVKRALKDVKELLPEF